MIQRDNTYSGKNTGNEVKNIQIGYILMVQSAKSLSASEIYTLQNCKTQKEPRNIIVLVWSMRPHCTHCVHSLDLTIEKASLKAS